MKNVCLLFFALALFSCKQEDDTVAPILVEEEIEKVELRNLGFEEGISTPNHWWKRVDGFTLNWTAEEAYIGDKSVSISTKTPQPDFCFWGQTFTDFEYGKGLKMKVKVKTDAIKGGGCSLVIRGDDTITPEGSAEYFATTQGTQFIGGTQDWTTYEVIAEDAIGRSIKSITVYMVYFANTTGTAYFDEVEILSADADK